MDEVLDAGGVVQWLQKSVADGRSLSVGEALAWLDVAGQSGTALTTDHLAALARATSAGPWQGSANAPVTVLYSNGTAWGTATALARNNPDAVRIIDNSHVGQLLSSDEMHEALEDAIAATYNGTGPTVPAQVDNFLFEAATLSVDGTRTEGGLWDQASARFAAETRGHVITLTPTSLNDRTFAVTELEGVLDNPNVDTINGVSRSVLVEVRDTALARGATWIEAHTAALDATNFASNAITSQFECPGAQGGVKGGVRAPAPTRRQAARLHWNVPADVHVRCSSAAPSAVEPPTTPTHFPLRVTSCSYPSPDRHVNCWLVPPWQVYWMRRAPSAPDAPLTPGCASLRPPRWCVARDRGPRGAGRCQGVAMFRYERMPSELTYRSNAWYVVDHDRDVWLEDLGTNGPRGHRVFALCFRGSRIPFEVDPSVEVDGTRVHQITTFGTSHTASFMHGVGEYAFSGKDEAPCTSLSTSDTPTAFPFDSENDAERAVDEFSAQRERGGGLARPGS
ncbi:hypothetical protein [Cellulomonas xiejunii]|uniref:hypothetical protein n=1 Tax=Cellulomonas xiejunii TaxID=2968083 RepID=UPI003FD7F537